MYLFFYIWLKTCLFKQIKVGHFNIDPLQEPLVVATGTAHFHTYFSLRVCRLV